MQRPVAACVSSKRYRLRANLKKPTSISITLSLLSGTNRTQPYWRRRTKATRRTPSAISLRITSALPVLDAKPTTHLHQRRLRERIGNRLSWRITAAALALSFALPFAASGQTPAIPWPPPFCHVTVSSLNRSSPSQGLDRAPSK